MALLYSDQFGELSCVITMRSMMLSSYAGDAALPGGKADNDSEDPLTVARREMFEEIGTMVDESSIIGTMPPYLSSKLLLVAPVVAYVDLHRSELDLLSNLPLSVARSPRSVEVADVYGVPLSQMLNPSRYECKTVTWGGLKYPLHYFNFAVKRKAVGESGCFTIWGLTSNIMLDVARIALGREPSIAHRPPGDYGDPKLIEALINNRIFDGPTSPNNLNFRKVLGSRSPLLKCREPQAA